jgi:hypothetical protein
MKNAPEGPKPPLYPLPERLLWVNPGQHRKANCFPGTEKFGRAQPALRAGSDAADIG